MINYLASLPTGRVVLWCYLLWYLFFAFRYFEAGLTLWLTSVGLSLIVGIALILSTSGEGNRLKPWQIFRLFLMPFCVSSFAALVKDHGFVLIFSSKIAEDLAAAGICVIFCLIVLAAKRCR